MSTLKVTNLRHSSASSDAITLASDGTATAKLTEVSGGQLSHRNKLINGAMQVAQRSTSAVTISDGSNEGYQTVDRWDHLFAGSMGGSITSQQVTDAPEGFRNSLKLTCASTGTTLDGTQHLQIRQKLEGQDILDFAYGDSSAKQTTISWYMKAVNPKVMCANVMTTLSSGRYWTKKFTPTTSWARYSMVVDGDTSNATDETSAHGYSVQFSLAIGSGKRQASDSTAWSSTANLGVDGMGNFLDGTSNELYITGVQVEVGDLTPYEHRSYGDELEHCMRYYQAHVRCGASNAKSTSQVDFNPILYPTMRAAPTVGQTGVISMNGDNADKTQGSTGLNVYGSDTTSAFVRLENFSSLTAWRAYLMKFGNTNVLTYSAEL